ncbi:hypothetical protein D3C85_174600 [compost metagenome]
MSLLKYKGSAGSALANVVSALRQTVATQGSEFASKGTTANLISMESLDEGGHAELSRVCKDLSSEIKDAFKALRPSMEDGEEGGEELTDVQLEAGAIAAMAAGDPAGYADVAMRSQAEQGAGIDGVVDIGASGAAGSVDTRETPSLESFDERELAKFLPYSIAFNVKASVQDSFSEMFYPTTVVPPEQGGLDITVRRTLVHNAIQHSNTGKATNWNRKNLVDAAMDHTILADESTALVPVVLANGSNADMFIDEALLAREVRRISNVDVTTAPLAINQELNLLGLSQHPGLIGAGVIDHTDAIDNSIGLDKIYVQIGADDVIEFPTRRLARSHFVKSVEGANREMNLSFRTADLVLDKLTKNVAGAVPAALVAVASGELTVRLAVNVNGDFDTQLGNGRVYSSPVVVDSIVNKDGVEQSLTAGAGAAIVTALKDSKVIAYELKAARTNSNRRTRGLLLDTNDRTFRFHIPLGAPISAPSPAGSNRDARDLEALISAARVRNTNNAVTRLLNYAETLRAYAVSVKRNDTIPEVEGVGRFLVRPFFEEKEIDLEAQVSSIRDMDRAEDINAILVNAIRDVSYRMYRDSGYQPALNAAVGGSQQPKLLIGTDVVLQRHLMVVGDSRTFGIAFPEYQIESSFDGRMKDTIVIALTRTGQVEGIDPLTFGVHAWIPELASSMMVQRDGGTYPEAMVQPRNLQINHLPMMAILKVKGLDKVLTNKIPVSTQEVQP